MDSIPRRDLETEGDGSADTTSWIPRPPEELESSDRLEDRDILRGAGVLLSFRDGRFGARRAWLRTRLPLRNLAAELAWLARADHRSWNTVRLETPEGRTQAAAGAVVAHRGPVLLREALSLTRPLRAPPSPRIAANGFEAPRGATSLAVRGAGARGEVGSAGAWCLLGRDASGASLVVSGLDLARRSWGLGTSYGARRAKTAGSFLRVVSLAGRAGSPGGRLSGEVLASPSRGPAFLFETARRSGPFLAAVRWRRRGGEEHPVAGELILEAGSGRSRTKLTWSSWSAHAASDDGLLELETALRRRGPGSSRVRIGGRPGGERYVLADIEIARERGRSFRLIASRREKRRAGASFAGSAWGGRLDWSARGRAGATFYLQATRVSAGDGVTSWATAIAPSGEEALVARGRAGVVVTGRAWLRAGPLQMEALLSDAGSSDADPPMRGTVRVGWAGESP